MIGRVTLRNGIVATLEECGRWSCADDPPLERFLNAAYHLRDVSPCDGIPGWAILDRVAAAFAAETVEKEIKPSGHRADDERIVY